MWANCETRERMPEQPKLNTIFQLLTCDLVLDMTIVPINDLSRWDNSERDRIDSRIRAVVQSGHFMLGGNTKEFEALLSQRLNGMNVMCVGN